MTGTTLSKISGFARLRAASRFTSLLQYSGAARPFSDVSLEESGELVCGGWQFLPAVADLMEHFAAAGMMAALLRRSLEGGSYHVKLSLARSAMWVQELGFLETATQASLPESDSYPTKLTSIESVYGKVSFLAPPLAFSNLTLPDASRLSPYGADAPEWLP